MTEFDKTLSVKGDMIPTLPGGLFVAANAAEIERLRAASTGTAYQAAAFVPLDIAAPLPGDVMATASVLVIEVDPQNEASLRRIAGIRAERPGLAIIAAIARADVSLVRALIRQGITDVAQLPFEPAELAAQILSAAVGAAGAGANADLAPMVTVVRSTGGCGATTVLTHLAAALARTDRTGKGVCVVDLDLQGGDVAHFVGETPKVTVSSLLEAGSRLDLDLVRSAVVPTRYGFSIIAAPDAITPLDTVDVDYLLRILTLARKEFGHVLVDLPANWTSWSLSAALASSRVLLITDPSIASLRQAKRRLQLLSSIGLSEERVGVVVNRLEKRLFRTIGNDEAAEALRHEVLAGLAAEGSSLRGAQDQGVLIFDVEGKSRFYKDIQILADTLVAQEG